jgi:hypothetical protein
MGVVVLKIYFSNHYIQNCGDEEQVKFAIFPFFVQKNVQTGSGSVNLHVCQVIYLILLISENEADKY